jgi:hypothetical protein
MEPEEALMAIVMGLDQHRAQVTTEWLDSVPAGAQSVRISSAVAQPGRAIVMTMPRDANERS